MKNTEAKVCPVCGYLLPFGCDCTEEQIRAYLDGLKPALRAARYKLKLLQKRRYWVKYHAKNRNEIVERQRKRRENQTPEERGQYYQENRDEILKRQKKRRTAKKVEAIRAILADVVRKPD